MLYTHIHIICYVSFTFLIYLITCNLVSAYCLHTHMSSTHHLYVICTATHGQHGPELSFTVTGICYWMEFVAGMLNCFISGSWFIICVDGFLCMSNLDIVHISSAYVHVICILSEHMCIMSYYLQWSLISSFLTQCQCDLYVISSTLYRSLHVVHTYTHYLLCIFHIPHIAYYLQLSFRILSPYTHVIRTSSILHLHCYPWSAWAWTIFYCDRNLLLNGICGRNVEFFHFRIM